MSGRNFILSLQKFKTNNTTLSEQSQDIIEKNKERDKINTQHSQHIYVTAHWLGTDTSIESGGFENN